MVRSSTVGMGFSSIGRLDPGFFYREPMTNQEFLNIADLAGAYWHYLGNPRPEVPHVRLASGLHGINYLNCSTILAWSQLNRLFAGLIAAKVHAELKQIGEIDWVVGAAMAGVPLAVELARQLHCRSGYVEKDDRGELTKLRFDIAPRGRVLVVNELMTTAGGSTWAVKKIVLERSPLAQVLVPAFVLVDRSSDHKLDDDTPVQSLFTFDFPKYEPGKCPYCEAGSPVRVGKPK